MSLVSAQSAIAAPKENPEPAKQEATKPGNGWGDKNHVHTGPPGQSVRASNHTTVNITANTGGNSANNPNGGNSVSMSGDISILVQITNFFNQLFGKS